VCSTHTVDLLGSSPKVFAAPQGINKSDCPLDFYTSPLARPKHLGLAPMPGPACSTSMGEEQQAERYDQTPVTCPVGQKPSFMTELEPGSTVYFKAFVTDERDDAVKLRFPGTNLSNLPCIAADMLPVYLGCKQVRSCRSLSFLWCAACKETKNKEIIQWVSRCSSRVWRGSLAKDAWTKVANGEGAWRPKKRQRTVGRPSKKKGPKLETGM